MNNQLSCGMYISGIGVANPPQRYSQADCWRALESSRHFSHLRSRSKAILKKVLLTENGIHQRALVFENLSEAFHLDPDTLHARFEQHAPRLARQAAEAALRNSGIERTSIGALIVSTCTGYLCPGLTSYVAESLELPSSILLLDQVGQGCGAAMPNLQTASALLDSGQARAVLSVCVEVCSAAFYLDDDPGVLISSCLFGDGAAAAVLTHESLPNRRIVRWKSFATHLNPADRNLLRFETRNGMLRNVLNKSVPLLVVSGVNAVLEELETKTAFKRDQISEWIMHGGGRDILAALQAALALEESAFRWSRQILEQFGNMSSPSVLFALDRALSGNAKGGLWFMAAYGAGITTHAAFLELPE
ncbi:MAG: 3-oxoacyl-[acyl-carrier-protein] synthase III C-terminal domain-containing protein [Verrucomicrobiota bacterium]|nr:3-oxoacyl-[acyl-carrier-protein] synthase III C-terminal domain-containing protein [Verrucomicrobiota bacterium]